MIFERFVLIQSNNASNIRITSVLVLFSTNVNPLRNNRDNIIDSVSNPNLLLVVVVVDDHENEEAFLSIEWILESIL